jgi:hypothetical protein
VSLPRHIRLAGLRAVEDKLAEIAMPTLASLKAQKTRELGTGPSTPNAPIPKVVSFPTS